MTFRAKIVLLLATCALSGAALTIPWHTIDAGGGESTGTSATGRMFTLRGTIGQFDATGAPSAGGTLTVEGGFWAVAVNDGAAPRLVIQKVSATTATVEWPAGAVGWQLQTSPDLATWSNLGTVIAGEGQITVGPQPGAPRLFYRLVRP